jgi:hypothetical protein
MSITRAQIARQLLAEGGVSLNDAQTMAPDGEFLAYINPKEAGILKAMGGSGRMTPMGIPSFTEDEEDTGDVSNPGGGSTGGSGGGNTGDDQEDDNARMMQAMGLTGPGFTNRGGGDDPPSFFDRVKSAITRFNPTRFSPTGIITRGLGNLFNRLGNLRGFNPDGTRRTQAEFERARDIRRAEKSIANIMGRDAPFTDLTLDRLADLYSVLGQNVPGNINESLIGTTNKMRTINDPVSVPITEGTMFDAEDDLGIVSQARSNPTFRDAMAQLNLQRGITDTNVANNLMAEQLSFPFDTFNTGDPYKDSIYDQDGNYKPSLNNLFAKVDGPAQIQMRRLEKQAGREQFGGTPLTPGERKALEQLKEMDADQDNVYTAPVSIV